MRILVYYKLEIQIHKPIDNSAKITHCFLWNFKIFEFARVVFAEPFLIPSLRVATVATSSSCFLDHEPVPFMISVFKAFHTDYTCFIHSAVKAFDNSILTGDDFSAYFFVYFLWLGDCDVLSEWFFTVDLIVDLSHLLRQYLNIDFLYFHFPVCSQLFRIGIHFCFLFHVIIELLFIILNFLWHLLRVIWLPIFFIFLMRGLLIHSIAIVCFIIPHLWSYLIFIHSVFF